MIRQRLHKSNEGNVVIAVCDSDILGKVFTQDNFVLDLNKDFYDESDFDSNSFLKLTKQPCTINAAGKNSIAFLLENNLIDSGDFKTIDDVPYVIITIRTE